MMDKIRRRLKFQQVLPILISDQFQRFDAGEQLEEDFKVPLIDGGAEFLRDYGYVVDKGGVLA